MTTSKLTLSVRSFSKGNKRFGFLKYGKISPKDFVFQPRALAQGVAAGKKKAVLQRKLTGRCSADWWVICFQKVFLAACRRTQLESFLNREARQDRQENH